MSQVKFGVWGGKLIEGSADGVGSAGAEAPAVPEGIAVMQEFSEGNKVRAIMGWDGFFVFDETVDPVDMARAYMDVVQRESCGKCVPCSMGTRVAADVLARIADGKGRMEDLDTLRAVGEPVHDGSLCELGALVDDRGRGPHRPL